MGARGFRTEVVPIIEIAVASSEPGQSDEIDLFIHVQVMDKSGDLRSNRIVGMILQHFEHAVVSPVGTGIRVGHCIFGVEPARH